MPRNERQLLERPYPRVKLHPATIKQLKKGHPWMGRGGLGKIPLLWRQVQSEKDGLEEN